LDEREVKRLKKYGYLFAVKRVLEKNMMSFKKMKITSQSAFTLPRLDSGAPVLTRPHAFCLLADGENPAKGFRGVGETLIGVTMKTFGP